jgi:branched-chain amino acid transport system ATP-binding protein
MQVLFGVDMHVGAREIVGLLGHNGSGKSTLLRVLAGLHRRASYEASLGGEQLAQLAPHLIARKGLVLVRGAEVFEGITVEEHLRLGARLGRLSGRPGLELEEVYDQIPVLGVLRRKLGPELSGGQRQLLALATAFMASPRCMILDEPTTGLDVAARTNLAEVLTGFAGQGVPLLLVEQNPTWLAEVAQRAYLIELGHIIAEGEPLSLLGAGGGKRDRDD